MHDLWIVAGIITVALAFDFVNGFHDAANSIATVVSTRVLSPRFAVFWAAFFNFIAFLIFDVHVARTIQKGVVLPEAVTLQVIAAGLLGAIAWNLITWYFGIPSSSSHALIGGFAGAAMAYKGTSALVYSGLVKVTVFIFVAPLLGMVFGFAGMVLLLWILRRATPSFVSRVFGKLQLLSAAAYSLGHGGNDAQKTMGIILAVCLTNDLYTGAEVDAHFPLWIVLSCHAAMGLGTLCGGWRIVKTMGQKICHLQPVHGFAAETAGAACLYLSTHGGIPVSTTHTITGAIFGVGSTRGIHAVKWVVAGRVMLAWVLTIPAAAIIAVISLHAFSAVGWRAVTPPEKVSVERINEGIRLRWEPVEGARKYYVYRFEIPCGEKAMESVGGGHGGEVVLGDPKTEKIVGRDVTGTEFTDKEIEPSKRYVYRLRSAGGGSRSMMSKEFPEP